jgi:hypothetical protein
MGGFGAPLGCSLVVASFACCFVVGAPLLVSMEIRFSTEGPVRNVDRSADVRAAPMTNAKKRNAIVGQRFAVL